MDITNVKDKTESNVLKSKIYFVSILNFGIKRATTETIINPQNTIAIKTQKTQTQLFSFL